jgi:hypothetical protein
VLVALEEVDVLVREVVEVVDDEVMDSEVEDVAAATAEDESEVEFVSLLFDESEDCVPRPAPSPTASAMTSTTITATRMATHFFMPQYRLESARWEASSGALPWSVKRNACFSFEGGGMATLSL